LPEEMSLQIGELFNAMGFSIFKTVLLYFILPIFGVVLIARYLFRIKGNALRVIVVVTSFVSLFLFANQGLPYMLSLYNSLIGN